MSSQITENSLKSAISELKEFAFQNQSNNTETISLVCEIESLVEKLEKRVNTFNFNPPAPPNMAPSLASAATAVTSAISAII